MKNDFKRLRGFNFYLHYKNYDLSLEICENFLKERFEIVEECFGLFLDLHLNLHVLIKTKKKADIKSIESLKIVSEEGLEYEPIIQLLRIPDEMTLNLFNLTCQKIKMGSFLKERYEKKVNNQIVLYKEQENIMDNQSKEPLTLDFLKFLSLLHVSDSLNTIKNTTNNEENLNLLLEFIKEHLKIDLAENTEKSKEDQPSILEILFLNQLQKLKFMYNILNTKTTLEQKQEEIERANYLLLKNTLQLEYNVISQKCKKFIYILESLFDIYDINAYTLANFTKRIIITLKEHSYNKNIDEKTLSLNSLPLKGHKFTSIVKLLVIIEIFRIEKDNIGLVLIHCLYLLIFNYIKNFLPAKGNEDELKIPDNLDIQSFLSQKIEDLYFKRTRVATEYANEFFAQIEPYIKLKFLSLKKSISRESNKLIEKLLDILNNIKISTDSISDDNKKILDNLQKDILEKKINLEFTEEEKNFLTEIFMIAFENLGFYQLKLVEEKENDVFKTTFYLIWNNNFVKDLLVYQTSMSDFPMIVKPNNWEKDRKIEASNKPLNFGGMLLNETNIFPGINLRTKKSSAKITEDTLDVINYLQSIPYTINVEFLQKIEKDFLYFLCCFLAITTTSLNKFLKFEKYNDDTNIFEPCIVEDIEELRKRNLKATVAPIDDFSKESLKKQNENLYNYYKNNTENLLQQEKSLGDKEKLQEIREIFKKANKEYNQIRNKLYLFFDLYFTAQVMKHFKEFYFTCLFDFRFRLYYVGCSFTPHAHNFVKSLLEFSNLTPKTLHFDKDYEKLVIQGWQKDAEKDLDKRFFYEKFLLNIPCSIVGHDVTASGFQIYGLLSGNFEILQLTNLLINKESNAVEKKDLYSNFRDKFVNYLEKRLNSSKITFLYKKLKNLSPVQKKFVLFVLKKLTEIVKDRSFIKDILMCYLYSEGHYSRMTKFEQELQKDFEVFALQQEIKNNSRKRELPTLFAVCAEFSLLFEKFFEITYPDIQEMKKFLEDTFVKYPSLEEQKGILIKGKDMSSILYLIEKQEVVRYKTISKDKIIRYTKKSFTDEFDQRKAKNSVGPNLIHYLDAHALTLVVKECKNSNISVYTAHDCFYTNSAYSKQIMEFYFQAIKKIFIHTDVNPFIEFVLTNIPKESLNNEDAVILEKIDIRFQQMKKEFPSYQMSPFILTP